MAVEFEWEPATVAGASFIGAPWKLGLHTTEGDSIEGAVGAYHENSGWPHLTVDLAERRAARHYPFTVSARGFLHPAGTPETNRANTIQVELVGRAADAGDYARADLEWFGAEVLPAIRLEAPFALRALPFVAYPNTVGDRQRLTWAEWAAYGGVHGHQHVPGNDHGDPGALDVATILAAAGGATPPQPKPPEEDDDMAVDLVKKDTDDAWWLTDWFSFKEHVLSEDEKNVELVQVLSAGGKIATDNGGPRIVRHPLLKLRLDMLPERGPYFR